MIYAIDQYCLYYQGYMKNFTPDALFLKRLIHGCLISFGDDYRGSSRTSFDILFDCAFKCFSFAEAFLQKWKRILLRYI